MCNSVNRMSPKSPDPDVRAALVEAAARLLAEEGPESLTTRRVAAEVEVSTMAVYTHFGGKEELVRAVVGEGFARLGQRLGAVHHTRDPVADLGALGYAYRAHARTSPHLYTVMFGGQNIPEYCPTAQDMAHGLETFEVLTSGVQRCIDADRFDDHGAEAMATQLWAASHGAATLELAGFLGSPKATETCWRELITHVSVGFGDQPELVTASLRKARQRAR